MAMQGYGYDPVAQFEEINPDVFGHLSQIATELGDDFTVITVVHGGIYLARVVDHADAYWKLTGEISAGKTGSWDSDTDIMANQLDEDLIIDDFKTSGRYIAHE